MQDYELIIIDDYEGDRIELVKRYLKKNGVELKHLLRSKPKCFPELKFNFLNAWNTGVLASTGDIILFLQDYTWLSPTCLERWMKWKKQYEEGYTIAGIANYWRKEPPIKKDLTNPLSLWEKPWHGSPKENGWKNPEKWIGDPLEMFYVVVPYKTLLAMNGFPEYVDYDSPRQITPAFLEKAYEVGSKIYTDKGNMCEMLHHRLWKPSSLWHSVKTNPQGSTKKVPRKNCFDLKKHVRGNLYWL